ncbi:MULTISPECIES: hypothetical protein [Sinorhizobium]|uniref:HAD family hydrolase n=1 Tax=Sinorhizobium TaxID=28105 RepID=UPI0011440DE0|nr:MULTISPECIES: hypothetical protein [Sinorhizobium]
MFFQNCFKDVLIPQANALGNAGWEVTVAFADYLAPDTGSVGRHIKLCPLDSKELDAAAGTSDPLADLHTNPHGDAVVRIAEYLSNRLPPTVDVILTWENPVPYLGALYPGAVILSQMPGSFSRSPYPSTVTIDPVGLYDRSILASSAYDIFNIELSEDEEVLQRDFSSVLREKISLLQPFNRSGLLNCGDSASRVLLLPLQVSAHYAFKATSGFNSQADFLAYVMDRRVGDERILVTQYKSSFTSESPLNEKNVLFLSKRWPNLVWRPSFDNVPSPSQFLLQWVDGVISHSSSLIFQAMTWGKQIETVGSSYFRDYQTIETADIGRNAKVSGFLLNRYNVDINFITKNREFLSSLLEEMVSRKRSGATGCDLLPKFSSIDPSYNDRLLTGFRQDAIVKALGKVNGSLSSKLKIVEDFRKTISSNDVKLISFDIFDTLVTRPFEAPSGLFQLLHGEAEGAVGHALREFPRVRSWAESRARSLAKDEEVTLSEIYEHVAAYYDLSKTQGQVLQELEIECERRVIVPRTLGKELWNAALASKKPVVLTSDMYLPESAIRDILRKCGYSGEYRIFLSSSFRKTKKSGRLYDVITSELSVASTSIVHVGDHPTADVVTARSRGIKPFYLPRALHRIQKNEMYARLFPPRPANERAKSVVAGLINYRLFEGPPPETEATTLFGGEPWRLGYAGLGPLYAGFAQWLHREATRDGRSKIYFLAREGYLFQQIYNELFRGEAISNEYLYCSRRSARVAALETRRDVADLAADAFVDGARLGELLKSRFGLAFEQLSGRARDRIAVSADTELSASPDGRARFVELMKELSEEILSAAADERRSYLKYLDELGFASIPNPAVVDLGWKGNMQAALCRMRRKPLGGYYFATLAGVETNLTPGMEVSSYLGERIGANASDPLIVHRKIVELLTCHTDPSLSHMILREGRLQRAFQPEPGRHRRVNLISEIHRGAILFAQDYQRSFGNFDPLGLIDYRLTSKVLSSFLSNPTREDAQLLTGLEFEDNFAGEIGAKFDTKGARVWIPGSKALTQKPGSPPSAAQPVVEMYTARIPKAVRLVEDRIVRTFWTRTQYDKYLNDEGRFFQDTKVDWVRRWGRIRALRTK